MLSSPTAKRLKHISKTLSLLSQSQNLSTSKSKSKSKSNSQFKSKPKPKPNPASRIQSPSPSPEDVFQQSLSQLPPRYTAQDLHQTISLQTNPKVSLLLLNWASHQTRSRPDPSTYILTLKRLHSAQLTSELDSLVSQILSHPPQPNSLALFNTIIYLYTQSRKLSKAISIFKHMKKMSGNDGHDNCRFPRPSLSTYNLLFSALLGRGANSYIHHLYMQTIRCLFRQLVHDGIEPDIFSLNSLVKGYVLSLHVNDALRVFHQMGVVYKCPPSAITYGYLVHGLSAQGRSRNALELYVEAKSKGFVLCSKAYNSLVNCLAIAGDLDGAVGVLREMWEAKRYADSVTFLTVLDAFDRDGRVGEGVRLLGELREKGMMDGQMYKKLMHGLQR